MMLAISEGDLDAKIDFLVKLMKNWDLSIKIPLFIAQFAHVLEHKNSRIRALERLGSKMARKLLENAIS